MTKLEAGKCDLVSPAAWTTRQIRYILSCSSTQKGAETGEKSDYRHILCEKRQEILGLFSLERRQVRGGTRTACEPCSTDDPLGSPFLIAEKERDVQKRADAGETLALRGMRVSMESCKHCFKRNPTPLGRNAPLWLGEGGMRTYIPIHWEMLHL